MCLVWERFDIENRTITPEIFAVLPIDRRRGDKAGGNQSGTGVESMLAVSTLGEAWSSLLGGDVISSGDVLSEDRSDEVARVCSLYVSFMARSSPRSEYDGGF